ncbi:hypothetical protein [Taibaiella chishuiensis]|uniref:Lipoprotein n=1 Tax=Taibaiella chishuiensis TaxID=1434707 RepID=A0A2P8D2X1_9BACT|nr:hypothetical protein [Taibaiella chishuiensis]PSK91516.1 hypothetical protein B0I18_10599 [Taibaiella chishuiensis]
MLYKTSIVALLGVCLLQSCGSGKTSENSLPAAPVQEASPAPATADVPYTVAEGYFVKNTVKPGPLPAPRITTQQDFDNIFGAAAHMGKNGMPTAIDFAKQFVIAVVADETDMATELKPISLKKETGDQLVFTYETIKGAKQSYTIRPVLMVVVDNTHMGTVVLKDQQAH